jgi:hypothetical protein
VTELERALAAGLARELCAVYNDVEVYEPAPWLDHRGPVELSDCRRLVVWHSGAGGTCILALLALHPEGLVLCLGPRHHREWSRIEVIPYADPRAVARILAGLATVEV